LTTSRISSRTEYLVSPDNILVFLLHSILILISSRIDGFSVWFNDYPVIQKWFTFYWATLYTSRVYTGPWLAHRPHARLFA